MIQAVATASETSNTTLDSIEIAALVAAAITLAVGLWLLLHVATRSKRESTITFVAWFLIVLTPVLVLFTVVPNSDMSIEFKGVVATGAVALFIWLLIYGNKRLNEAFDADKLRQERDEARDELVKAQDRASAKPLHFERHRARLSAHDDRYIGIVTGDLAYVNGIDLWTNSENAKMQMARVEERAVSATIRRLGSERDELGKFLDDAIQDELKDMMDGTVAVPPYTALVTGSGQLVQKGVRGIIHVASVQPVEGKGFDAYEEVEPTVKSALAKADVHDFDEHELLSEPQSILLPLFGAGQGGADVEDVATSMIAAVIDYLGSSDGRIREVYLLAYTQHDLDACQAAINGADDVEDLVEG